MLLPSNRAKAPTKGGLKGAAELQERLGANLYGVWIYRRARRSALKMKRNLVLMQVLMIDQSEIQGYQKVCTLLISHHSSLLLAEKHQSLFVLKIYSVLLLRKFNLLHQLYLEVQLMRLLQHPGILRLHRTISLKDQLAVVTDFCQGGDLRNLRKSGKLLPIKVLKFLMVELTRSVMYMHQKGLIHRDIKPANILITKDCHLKIADLASTLVRDVNKIKLPEQLINKIKSSKQSYFQRDRTDSLVGTAGFMINEFGQSQKCDYKDDYYALLKVLQFLADQSQMKEEKDLMGFAQVLRKGSSEEISQHSFINWQGDVFQSQSILKKHFNHTPS